MDEDRVEPKPVLPRDTKPLIGMSCVAIGAVLLAAGLLWDGNSRYDITSASPLAENPIGPPPPLSEPANPPRR